MVAPSVPTLAELFAKAGFRTAAVMNVVFCSPESGLSRGFESYDYSRTDRSNVGSRDARATTDAALAWLEKVRGEPFFLVVHYFDAHLTYDPPAPYDTMFEPDAQGGIERGFGSADQVRQIADGTLPLTDRQKQSLVARYDGEIRFLDDQFGRLRRGLEEQGLWPRTTVLVVADHGEEFWDHGGFEHGHTHLRELISVPLILRRPGAPGGVVRTERVRQIDIAPTLLEQAGVAVPTGLPGQPLGRERREALAGRGQPLGGRPALFPQRPRHGDLEPRHRRVAVLRTGRSGRDEEPLARGAALGGRRGRPAPARPAGVASRGAGRVATHGGADGSAPLPRLRPVIE